MSNDIRLIQVKEGGSAFGVPLAKGGDPFAYLSALTSALEAGQGVAGGESFDTDAQEDTEVITVAPDDGSGNKVYNFAVARVHYQALSSKAQSVRVFFRLFAANSTATDFQPDTTYRRYAAYSPVYPVPAADDFQNVLPELGLSAGEYVPSPVSPRRGRTPRRAEAPTPFPVCRLPTRPMSRISRLPADRCTTPFMAACSNINQLTARHAALRQRRRSLAGSHARTHPAGLHRQRAHLHYGRDRFDPVPINTGTAPFNSDKLAQRNISWSYVANPGVESSRRAQEPLKCGPRR